MSLGITHFAVGQTATLLLLFVIDPDIRRRHRLTLSVLGGVWAMFPDAHHLYEPLWDSTKPIIHDSLLANLFWFHGALDALDTSNAPRVAVLALVVLLVVAVVTDRTA